MSLKPKDGGAAFPKLESLHTGNTEPVDGVVHVYYAETTGGMSLREWFMGQALSNPELCNGRADDWSLGEWFGKGALGLTRFQIAAKQAELHADAMLSARGGQTQ